MWIVTLFLAFLVIAVIQMWIFSRFSLRRLSYRRWFSPDIVNEGDEVTMYEAIRNEKLLPVPWLRIEAGISSHLRFGAQRAAEDNAGDVTAVQSGARQYHRSIFSLGPYAGVTRRHHVTCTRRGFYRMRTAALTVGDLLGLGHRKTREVETDSLLVVYPRTLALEDVFSDRNSFSGDIVVRRWIMEDPFLMRGVRDYTGNEPYNRINWKATAKTGSLQVQEYDYSADIRLLILLNIDTDADQWSAVIDERAAEHAISVAASIAQYMLENGIETGFASNAALSEEDDTISIPPQTGTVQLADIFTALSRLTLRRALTFPTMLQTLASGELESTDILLITAYTDEGIDRQVDLLRERGCRVEICIPAAAADMGEVVS